MKWREFNGQKQKIQGNIEVDLENSLLKEKCSTSLIDGFFVFLFHILVYFFKINIYIRIININL